MELEVYFIRSRKGYMLYTLRSAAMKMRALSQSKEPLGVLRDLNILAEEIRQAEAYRVNVTLHSARPLIRMALAELKKLGASTPDRMKQGTRSLQSLMKFKGSYGFVRFHGYTDAIVVEAYKTSDAASPWVIFSVHNDKVTRLKKLPD